MAKIFIELSKYFILMLMLIYTFECFGVFRLKTEEDRRGIYFRQNIIMYSIQFISYLVLFISDFEWKYIVLFVMQLLCQIALILIYKYFYRGANRLIINNMCLLLSIGFITISRLSFEKAVKQFAIAFFAMGFTVVVLYVLKRFRHLNKFFVAFALLGIFLLMIVMVFSKVVNGSKINLTIANYTFQPSEIVKITFIFAIAGMLYHSTSLKYVIISAITAAAHVLILVASKDLGSAVIFFSVYFAMLYVATGKYLYYLCGFSIGILGSVMGYLIFSHVRVRVSAWLNPLKNVNDAGYQISQSLFAIGTGGFFGMGLNEGSPGKIPVVSADFIFSAIAEEFGMGFGICLVLICVSCFVMFMNIAMLLKNSFYKYIAVGLGVNYGFQVLLTIGGVTKFIPMTGVTLPLVSYGGTSVLVTLVMFSIIQGLYIMHCEEEAAGYYDQRDYSKADVPLNPRNKNIIKKKNKVNHKTGPYLNNNKDFGVRRESDNMIVIKKNTGQTVVLENNTQNTRDEFDDMEISIDEEDLY